MFDVLVARRPDVEGFGDVGHSYVDMPLTLRLCPYVVPKCPPTDGFSSNTKERICFTYSLVI